MSQLQDLRARLRLDDSEFKRGVAGAKGQASGLGSALRGALLPVAGALSAAFSARALFRGVMQGATEIDAVAKSARALDSSIGGFRALEIAAGEAGVGIETLRDQSINLGRQLASGGADASLRALGLEAKTLGEMDVDQRFAAIADRVKDLGLSGGETAQVLRKMGITNRDMVLAMTQGGDAFRKARDDVQDYGLALSQVDAGTIEAANDSIGRLSLAGQYLRQVLAMAVLPALGDMARAFTESLREGGFLRAIIDGLGMTLRGAVGVFRDGVTVISALFRWVADLATSAADLAGGWDGIKSSVRTALSPLLSALDVAASMTGWFADLIRGAGGFGEALSALGDLAAAVWEGMKTSASALGPALAAVWETVKAGFFNMLASLQEKWASFLRSIAGGLANVPGFDGVAISVGTAAIDAQSGAYASRGAASDAQGAAAGLRAEAAARTAAGSDVVKSALERLNAVVRRGREETDTATESALKFASALDDVAGDGAGGKGGGGGARGAAAAINDVAKASKDAAAASEKWADQMAGHFDGLITGGKGLQGVLQGMARQLESEGWKMLFKGLSGAGAGASGGGIFGFLGGLLGIGKNANGTPNWRGGLTAVGERGMELVDLPRGAKVHDAQTSARMLRGMGGDALSVTIGFDASAGGFTAFVRDTAGRVVAQARPAIVKDAVQTTYAASREQRIA